MRHAIVFSYFLLNQKIFAECAAGAPELPFGVAPYLIPLAVILTLIVIRRKRKNQKDTP